MGHPHMAEALTLGIYPAVLGNPANAKQRGDTQGILPRAKSQGTWNRVLPIPGMLTGKVKVPWPPEDWDDLPRGAWAGPGTPLLSSHQKTPSYTQDISGQGILSATSL